VQLIQNFLTNIVITCIPPAFEEKKTEMEELQLVGAKFS
jgi:hypothetical protein